MHKRKILILALITLIFFSVFYPFTSHEPINYIDRSTGSINIEKVPSEFWLQWLYNNPAGKLSLHTLVKRKILSDWYGKRMDLPKSAKKINSFINDFNIDLTIAEKQNFNSFNDFFCRKLKPNSRSICLDSNILISPADGKIFAYNNIDEQDFIIKSYRFNLEQYLQNKDLTKKYAGGSLLIIRLCPTDYHRFHFPLSGTVGEVTNIDGDYYSVSPIAIKNRIEVFCMNKRSYVELFNPIFGNVIISEVGATLVGSIIQTYKGYNVQKGSEKGYFKFGGSTVILIFEKGKLEIDSDLIKNTNNKLETNIKMGAKIGKVLY